MNLPQPPSTDINDPKVRSRAKAVATRRNNQARKKLELEREKLALFADQIETVDQLPQDTAEAVIERRKIVQAAVWIDSCERQIQDVLQITRYKNQIFAMVSEEEYGEIYAKSFETSMPEWAYWYGRICHIKARQEPMPAECELVLTWLVDWAGEPPTTMELLHYRGDGMTSREVWDALQWLEDREYIRGGRIRACRFTPPHQWETTPHGSSSPFSATIAGREYFQKGEAA